MSGPIRGSILDAPFQPAPGRPFGIRHVSVAPNPADGAMLISSANLVNGPLLALWCSRKGAGHHRGSAFLVAPGVAIAAHHVIEDYQDKEGLLSSDAELLAFGQQGGLALSWVVRSILRPAAGDVAILLMDLHTALPDGYFLHVFELGARLPRLGERGTVLGMRSNLPGGVNVIPDERRDLGKLEAATIASSGAVIDVYPQGRPLIDTPCFALEATAIGCMSGGPVFDSRGLVIGMISTSIKVDDGYVTTASLLWQALWRTIGPTWPPGWMPDQYRLLDVMHPAEAARLRPGENGLISVDASG